MDRSPDVAKIETATTNLHDAKTNLHDVQIEEANKLPEFISAKQMIENECEPENEPEPVTSKEIKAKIKLVKRGVKQVKDMIEEIEYVKKKNFFEEVKKSLFRKQGIATSSSDTPTRKASNGALPSSTPPLLLIRNGLQVS